MIEALKNLDKLISRMRNLYKEIERIESETNYLVYEEIIGNLEIKSNEMINDLVFQIVTKGYAKKKMKKMDEYKWIEEANSDVSFVKKMRNKTF